MAKKKLPRPTNAELEILSVLWTRGASTVREIHESLNSSKPTLYTTVLKFLQIMTEKGLVRRDDTERAHVYVARLAQEQTQRQILSDLADKAFGGSAAKLVMQALSAKKTSKEELAGIRKMLDELEDKAR